MLEKFIVAQKNNIKVIKKELKNQKKTTHWIWYTFPQLKHLGKNIVSRYFGLSNLKDAKRYFENDYLRKNLLSLVKIMLKYKTNDLIPILGEIDTKKFRSSMTLFYLATEHKIFKKAIDKFFYGEYDKLTISLLRS